MADNGVSRLEEILKDYLIHGDYVSETGEEYTSANKLLALCNCVARLKTRLIAYRKFHEMLETQLAEMRTVMMLLETVLPNEVREVLTDCILRSNRQ